MIGGIGIPELIVILVIVLIIFGAGKLPEIGAGLGRGIQNFKKASKEIDGDDKQTIDNNIKAIGSDNLKKETDSSENSKDIS